MKCFLAIALCSMLTACGAVDDPMHDNDPISANDYPAIRLEIERCKHFADEGGFHSMFMWSPRTTCLKHLRSRIVATGKVVANQDLLGDLDD